MVPISADESAKHNSCGSRKRPYAEDSEEEEPYVMEYLVDQPRDRFMLAAERLAGVLRELDKHTRTKLMIEIVRILNYREMLANAERTENTKYPRLSD